MKLLGLFLSLLTFPVYCQIGIGTTSPDISSVMDVSSTSKGFLYPRMTSSQRDVIQLPAEGLAIYNLDEHCLQINTGSPSAPTWDCVGRASEASVLKDCNVNGFEGIYIDGTALTSANKFSVTISNQSFTTASISFGVGDLVLSGVSGLSVVSVSSVAETLIPGSSVKIEYTIAGTPSNIGTLTGEWTKIGLNCTKTVEIVKGDAMFTLPQTITVVSVNDGIPSVDVQGIIDNGSNQLTVNINYTSGVGDYDAYLGAYKINNPGTSEGGDANSFRLSYPAGTFSSSGSITATIEVDGDGSFNVEKQLFGIQKTIASLEFQLNGNNKGSINIEAIGGIADRNFADANHKFVYLPITAADGNIWLNNNLGANYSNINHINYSPTQQATSYDDHHAYGSLFQWGRFSDGHELINYTSSTTGTPVNGITTSNALTDTPGHSLFINGSTDPFDWRFPKNDNLWQGESGVNNPCPVGYRLPTEVELTTLLFVENIEDGPTAASSSLAFTAFGGIRENNGIMKDIDNESRYWTSSHGGDRPDDIRITFTGTNSSSHDRANSYSIRCIKN